MIIIMMIIIIIIITIVIGHNKCTMQHFKELIVLT